MNEDKNARIKRLAEIAQQGFPHSGVTTVGGNIIVCPKSECSPSCVVDDGARMPRFRGKSEFLYLLEISEVFSIEISCGKDTGIFFLTFEGSKPNANILCAADFLYPEEDKEADAAWEASQPNLWEIFFGTAPMRTKISPEDLLRLQKISEKIKEVFGDMDCDIREFGTVLLSSDDSTKIQWTIGANTEKSIVFSGEKLKLLRQIVVEADDVQITLDEENAAYLFYIAFGVHDVRFLP